jgi:hypothetical protein
MSFGVYLTSNGGAINVKKNTRKVGNLIKHKQIPVREYFWQWNVDMSQVADEADVLQIRKLAANVLTADETLWACLLE